MRPLLLSLALLFPLAATADVICDGFGSYRECRVGTTGRISLVSSTGENPCVERVTWGVASSGVVWVDRGCAATFRIDEVTGRVVDRARVVCESENGGHRVCPADTRQGVTLGRQLSVTACVEEVTWGYEPGSRQIWVDDGCRGEFILGRGGDVHRPAPRLDGLVTCESRNGRRAECQADTAGGVQLARTLSDSPCRFNQEWGYDDGRIWVTKGCRADFAIRAGKTALRTVVCQSLPGERYHCEADTRFGVALIGENGESDCILERTWGFDEKGVWVAEGCGGQFGLGGYRLSASSVPASAARITCQSLDGKMNECEVEGIRGAGLVRAIGDDVCVLNRTWGFGRGGIWVTDGCRAEFAILR
ncbi:MAG TPA: DUF3011 domain-containing protein [Thermoanaerobaculia bacterium]|nr:DUF3011 domain-containing protein [Thermoanaerobaculia bacterium]